MRSWIFESHMLRTLSKKQQRGFGVVLVVFVFSALLGLAIAVLFGDINQSKTLVEQSRTDMQNQSLQIAEELYQLNPRATDVDPLAPFNMANLCTLISMSFLRETDCVASPAVLNVGRDGIVRYSSVALTEDLQNIPYGVVDGEQIQLQARAELQRHLRRIASVMENYHYQQSLLHLGGNASSDLLNLGGGKVAVLDNFLSCAYDIDLKVEILPCVDGDPEPLPITTGIFTKADEVTIFNTTVHYKTDGDIDLVSAFDDDGLLNVNLDDPNSNIAGIVMAETPWPRDTALGGNHFEWVFVRKVHANE